MRTLALFLSLFIFASCERSGFAPGDFAPKFTLKNASGELVSLEDLRGKVVLLNFWATWCAPCVVEMPSLERLHSRMKERGFTVLSIATQDKREEVQEFITKAGLTFSVLFDDGGEVSSLYKTTGLPETIILSREGKISMFLDPKTNEPVTRIRGEREWDSQEAIASISRVLGGE